VKACTFLSGISDCAHLSSGLSDLCAFIVRIKRCGAHFLSAMKSCVLYDVRTAYFLYFVARMAKSVHMFTTVPRPSGSNF
jgi:hypothetical protein